MPARGWWWQRFHPAVRVLMATVYFGVPVAIIVAGAIHAAGNDRRSPAGLTTEQVAPSTTTGEESSVQEQPLEPTGPDLYESRCASCHGPALEGGSGPELGPGSETVDLSDSRILSRIRDGRNEMPGFSGILSEGEIELLLDFLRQEQLS